MLKMIKHGLCLKVFKSHDIKSVLRFNEVVIQRIFGHWPMALAAATSVVIPSADMQLYRLCSDRSSLNMMAGSILLIMDLVMISPTAPSQAALSFLSTRRNTALSSLLLKYVFRMAFNSHNFRKTDRTLHTIPTHFKLNPTVCSCITRGSSSSKAGGPVTSANIICSWSGSPFVKELVEPYHCSPSS